MFILFNWELIHTRLENQYEAHNYKNKKHKKIDTYREFVQKEPTVKRCLLISDLKPIYYIIGKPKEKPFYRQRIRGSSCARKKTVDMRILVTSRNGDRKILESIRITSGPFSRLRKQNHLNQLR